MFAKLRVVLGCTQDVRRQLSEHLKITGSTRNTIRSNIIKNDNRFNLSFILHVCDGRAAAPYLANSFARVETALVGSCIIRHCAHPALCENVFYYISFARLDTR